MKTNKYSELYHTIWATIMQIPPGKVATYGQIARLSGIAGNARIVGYALHKSPANIELPWYRVINSKGKISFSKDDGSYTLQKALLEKEGVIFDNETIDLKRYGWQS